MRAVKKSNIGRIGQNSFKNKVKRVFASCYQVFVLDDENHIWVTGFNKYGILGIGDSAFLPRRVVEEFKMIPEFTTERIVQIESTQFNTYVVTEMGKVFVSGLYLYRLNLSISGENNYRKFTFAKSTRGLKVASIAASWGHLWLKAEKDTEPCTYPDEEEGGCCIVE